MQVLDIQYVFKIKLSLIYIYLTNRLLNVEIAGEPHQHPS
jgi:hypothetical protein